MHMRSSGENTSTTIASKIIILTFIEIIVILYDESLYYVEKWHDYNSF